MNWFRELGYWELIAFLWFVAAYGVLFWRYRNIAKSMKVVFRYLRSKLLIRFAYFSLIIVALLGPSFGEIQKEVKTSGKDIIFVTDLSSSMDANDIMPTRLDKVKFELKRITENFAADRVGLIIFSTDAFMQCPLTNDPSAVKLFIETLNTKLVPRGSTDLAPALQMALDKHLAEENTVKKSSKVIILVSDGEDFGEEAEEVAEEIHKNGIRLFTVGIGTEQGGKIKLPDGRFKVHNGQEIVTRLKTEFLQTLAQKTNGQFFLITDKANETGKLINAIEQIEGEVRGIKKLDVSANKYRYFLYLALFLILLDLLIVLNVIEI
jgi:Ca-activated chloride channel family protein